MRPGSPEKLKLKKFGRLTPKDFKGHPIWAACHSFDHDEPWFGETDEETFRPWFGGTPVDPSEGMFLVAAQFLTARDLVLSGFVTPVGPNRLDDLGLVQPHVFINGRPYGFWAGMVGLTKSEKQVLLDLTGGSMSSTFPIKYSVLPGLVTSPVQGKLLGFYRLKSLTEVVVE